MNKFSIIPFTVFLILGCSNPENKETLHITISDSEVLDKLFSLSETQNYFELQSYLGENKGDLSEEHALYFNAIIKNAFNKPQASNVAISKLIESTSNTIDDTLMKKLYHLKMLNHTNLYEYDLANQTSDFLLKNYSDILDSAAIADFDNTNKIWAALKHVPKQKITRNQDFTIPLVRDIAGLFNIDVTFSDTTKNFIFDTGANFSVIRRSLVEKMGLTLIESDFMVDGSTGKRVKSDLAIADQLDIGGITYENVVFMVFDDEALSFPGYDIYGVIGYPVIEAMKEIHITKDNYLFVPKNLTEYSHSNFALDGFVPLVLVKHKGDNLIFSFDTGAYGTALYSKYLKKYRKQIEANYQKETFSIGSAGGIVEFEGYKISGVVLSIAGSEVELDDLKVHIDAIGQKESNFHGNLGQDFIKQFDKMIISFEHSSILFE
jgi:predicted aspartyl protease